MQHPGFYEKAGPFGLSHIANVCDATYSDAPSSEPMVSDVRPLDEAGGDHVSFLVNPKYLPQLTDTQALACFVSEKFSDRVPQTAASLISSDPYRSFAKALQLFYPDAVHPATWGPTVPQALPERSVDPSAALEEGVIVEPGAVVAPEAQIGSGTRISSGAFVGYRVHVGRDCYIGPNAVLTNSLIGNSVNVHAGAKVGQDGFGFAMGAEGHLKVPQIGRVIIQDHVEIGGNSTVDRGAVKDTVIGEGTKIDNLVQIGHNVVVGRHCVIVALTGISGSVELCDYVVMGGQSGSVGHVTIGTGAQIAGASHVKSDVPPGSRWGGTPAKPLKDWARELTVLKKLARDSKKRS